MTEYLSTVLFFLTFYFFIQKLVVCKATYNETEKLSGRFKRSNNGVPFELYCETLVVTDKTVFDTHKRLAQIDNVDLVFLHMKAYYAHLMNGVRLSEKLH
jgi:hypothetical protein